MEDNKQGLLMMKVNGNVVYFNIKEIDKLLSETFTSKGIEENEGSNLQQKIKVCGGVGEP